MAKSVRRVQYGSSANQKIVQVNQAQGVKGIGGMQGTTRVIFDAVPLAATTTNSTINIFENCKTRTFPLTNLSENKLQVGESLAMQRFSIYIIETTSGTTNALGTMPLSYFSQFQRFYAATLNFSIAQDQVIKRLPLTSMQAHFNPHSRFSGYYQFQVLATDPVTSFFMNQDIYHFDNDIIIPPQIEFVASLTLPPISLPSGFDFYLAMKIEGLGSLYAPKANY